MAAPALLISVDGTAVASVCTADVDVAHVEVSGTVTDESTAWLHVSGGLYPQGAASTHLTWVDFVPIQIGQRIRVEFVASGSTFPPGKTIDELYPDEEEDCDDADDAEPLPRDAVLDHAESQSKYRQGFEFAWACSDGQAGNGRSVDGDHGFAFNVVKNPLRADRARAHVHTYTIGMLREQSSMRDVFEAVLEPDMWVEFCVTAVR